MSDRLWYEWLEGRVGALADADLLRELRPLTAVSPVVVRHHGRRLDLFSSNDYLGLSAHPEVRDAAARAAARVGMGPRGSALVCGYTEEHEALEEALAELKGAEAALLTPTGFAANLAAITALADGPDCEVFSDALNHASIIDGCRMARRVGAGLSVYRHGDMRHLEELLQRSTAPRKLIVTDSVFSMDGDLAPLAEIAALKERYGAWLLVDEAHGTLVFGDEGGGVAQETGVEDAVDVHVGTLSKAVGACGGFVAGSARLRELVLNRGRAFVFSTALPLPVVAAARAAIAVARAQPSLRRDLWTRIEALGAALERKLTSPIVPIVLGDAAETMRMSEELLRRGFHVPGIRPPTVPPGTARLRIALSAAHRPEDVDRLVESLREIGAIVRR